jgi:hypothetical protein
LFNSDCKVDDLSANDSYLDRRSLTSTQAFLSHGMGNETFPPPPAETLKDYMVGKATGDGKRKSTTGIVAKKTSGRKIEGMPTETTISTHDVFATSDHEHDAVITVNLLNGNCLIKVISFSFLDSFLL